jgi:catechol 2,3-dioxygenase-like lactoylglutathione lyase family enzyme
MLEFGLYVEDVSRASAFYHNLFGFPVLVSKERIAALDVEEKQVLLLFKHGASSEPMTVPGGGLLPPHDGHGTSHLAFSIQAADLKRWEQWLGEHDVEVESEIEWERGGRSLYFRDPDGHLLEIVTPGVWETY